MAATQIEFDLEFDSALQSEGQNVIYNPHLDNRRFWENAMLSNCGEEATVVDIMSVTRALLETNLDDGIDMV